MTVTSRIFSGSRSIDRKPDGRVHLTQPHLINSIIKDLHLDNEGSKTKDTPAASSKTLTTFPKSLNFDGQPSSRPPWSQAQLEALVVARLG